MNKVGVAQLVEHPAVTRKVDRFKSFPRRAGRKHSQTKCGGLLTRRTWVEIPPGPSMQSRRVVRPILWAFGAQDLSSNLSGTTIHTWVGSQARPTARGLGLRGKSLRRFKSCPAHFGTVAESGKGGRLKTFSVSRFAGSNPARPIKSIQPTTRSRRVVRPILRAFRARDPRSNRGGSI